MAGKHQDQHRADPCFYYRGAVFFKYHIVKGMAVCGMPPCFLISIATMLVSVLISVFEGTIGGKGTGNCEMMMMWYQTVSQEG